jgi:RNA polymerase sigma-70 factor, ECF subfamily
MTDRQRAEHFEAVFGRVYEPLQRYLRRRTDPATAEDVLAETLTTVWRRLDQVPDEPLDLPWCYSVARHTLANARRSGARRLRLVERASESGHLAMTAVGADASIDELDPELDAALDQLGDDDREVLRLWAWEQLEAREIAEVLDISPNAASIRLHRAKGHLRDLLDPERAAPEVDTDGAGPGGQNR